MDEGPEVGNYVLCLGNAGRSKGVRGSSGCSDPSKVGKGLTTGPLGAWTPLVGDERVAGAGVRRPVCCFGASLDAVGAGLVFRGRALRPPPP